LFVCAWLGMVKQQKVQTLDAIFGGIFNSKTHVKGDYNKINRCTPFICGLTRVFTEGDCSNFLPLFMYIQQ